jgi:hypothetical protein
MKSQAQKAHLHAQPLQIAIDQSCKRVAVDVALPKSGAILTETVLCSVSVWGPWDERG